MFNVKATDEEEFTFQYGSNQIRQLIVAIKLFYIHLHSNMVLIKLEVKINE